LSLIVGCVSTKSDVRHSGGSILASRYYGVWKNVGPQYLNWWVIDASGAHTFGITANSEGRCSADIVTVVVAPNQIDVKSGDSGLVTLRVVEGDLLMFQGERDVALHKRVNREDICRGPDGTYLEGAPYATAGSTADWVSVAKYERGNQNIFVDVSSVQVKEDIRRALIRWVYPASAAKAQSYIIYDSAFNCADGTNRDESVTIYYNDGTNHLDDPNDSDSGTACRTPTATPCAGKPWLPLPPGTPWSDAMHFVCAWKPKP
jgi:hypothetical protein